MVVVVIFNHNEEYFMNKDDVYKFILKIYLHLKHYDKVHKNYISVTDHFRLTPCVNVV